MDQSEGDVIPRECALRLLFVFLEVVTSCFCRPGRASRVILDPHRLKIPPKTDTLCHRHPPPPTRRCLTVMSRGKSAAPFPGHRQELCLDLKLKSHGGQDPGKTAGSQPPSRPVRISSAYMLLFRYAERRRRRQRGEGGGVDQVAGGTGHSSRQKGRRQWRQSDHGADKYQEQSKRSRSFKGG